MSIPDLNTGFLSYRQISVTGMRPPGIKNGDEHLVVLGVAKSVIEGQHGLDQVWVFP